MGKMYKGRSYATQDEYDKAVAKDQDQGDQAESDTPEKTTQDPQPGLSQV